MNQLQQLKQVRNELTRFMITYKFGLDEMNTKLNILKEEFQHIHSYNPIEHIKSRIKSPESILKKVYRKNLDISMDAIRENIKDIVGIRIVCSFISDIYKVSEMIQNQQDITVVEVKDYIKHPKSNGYKSLHLILSIPVFMSDRTEQVYIEIQIRSVAMDFWASLEHKIYYKYNGEVPQQLIMELTEAANVANKLDSKMEKLNNEVNNIKSQAAENEDIHFLQLNEEDKVHLPLNFLQSFLDREK
ncbi:GTP pyrophosphokinase family protein [Oceanobacillus profundus]|uniref:GTP pyrophosphokinase n=1 Tax=Oceanobacillus TaxID=182709 RepID=UPI0026E48F23|nr:GTP pyrophosphokinase family protein [Oceanobacillus profundus]MDO6451272.1 GTP pyrophosphokinase family protein [Oceanobacillus profundus]